MTSPGPPLGARGAVTRPQQVAKEAVASFLASDEVAQNLGITVSTVAPGAVTAHLHVTSTMLNGHGTAHGGVVFTFADVAFAMASNSHGQPAVGRSASIEYTAPAYPGDTITATAVQRSVVGRGAVYDVAVTRDHDGQLLAEFRGHSRRLLTSATETIT